MNLGDKTLVYIENKNINNMANNYKNTVSGTIGAGFKSVLSGQGKKYYILEHKVSSKYHRAGESQEIIVDQIEIGRDPRCQVRFDESFATVSRRHAAIVRDGDNWKLVQISTTNKTFLNGVPVEKEWYLQNGDEIQLSVNGPKLGFIIPQGNKSTVNTIGLSRRLSLFRQQALRPYKTALWLLGILLLLAIGLGTFFIIRGNNINKQLREELAADSIAFHKKLESMSGTLNSMTRDYKTLLSQVKVKSSPNMCITSRWWVIPSRQKAVCRPSPWVTRLFSMRVTSPTRLTVGLARASS